MASYSALDAELIGDANEDAPRRAERRSPFEQPGRWWLVHTKPRNEKALGTDLGRIGVSYYLPLTRVARRSGGIRSEVRLPLFPGYLFLRGDEDQRYKALATRRAVRVLSVSDQDSLHRELVQLERATTSGNRVDLYPRIRKGRKCRIVRGSLKGLEGPVLSRRSLCCVYLSVSLLGQSAEVEVDPSQLELIG